MHLSVIHAVTDILVILINCKIINYLETLRFLFLHSRCYLGKTKPYEIYCDHSLQLINNIEEIEHL